MLNYLLVYDSIKLGTVQTQLHSLIKQHKLIVQWSQPFVGAYIIKTNSDIYSLSVSFEEFFTRDINHIICPISIGAAGGILPSNIWDWLGGVVNPASLSLLNALKQN
jgi:hypothetical protein